MIPETIKRKLPTIESRPKPIPGSTADKYRVVLDGGKTIIFISDKSREEEIILKYTMRNQHTKPEV
ncbi:MAG: hypothetical protein ACOH2V_12880 [Candidatus Saccharimonadaceae bacterium]